MRGPPVGWGGAPSLGSPHANTTGEPSEELWAFKSPAGWGEWLGGDWLADSLYGGIYSGLPHIGFIAKIRGLEAPVRWCLAWKVEFKGRIGSFFRACKVCPSCPDTGIFLKKADGFGPPDQTEKGFLGPCTQRKKNWELRSIIDLNFIFNSRKIRRKLTI